MSRLDLPDRLYPQISPDPLVSVPERPAAVPCYSTKGQLAVSTVRVSSYCSQTPGSQLLHGSGCEVRREVYWSWP